MTKKIDFLRFGLELTTVIENKEQRQGGEFYIENLVGSKNASPADMLAAKRAFLVKWHSIGKQLFDSYINAGMLDDLFEYEE